jgi:phosphoribosylcarboxyaminoimidazole (NCAIR) mutase
MNIKAHFPSQCNVTSAMTLLPFIMVPVKCPNLRNCAVFDIVKKSGGTTEIRLLNCMFSLLLSHHEIP